MNPWQLVIRGTGQDWGRLFLVAAVLEGLKAVVYCDSQNPGNSSDCQLANVRQQLNISR
jgi:hypothetical protein